MANQKSVRYSVSISYFTNIAVQNVNKVRTCAHEWTSSLSIIHRGARFISAIPISGRYLIITRKYNELNHLDRPQLNINSDKMTSVQFSDHHILIDYDLTTAGLL
jgi:hypothetical protein